MEGSWSTGHVAAGIGKVMLCAVCKGSIASVRQSQPGIHSGPKPELFEYPDRQDTWTGAHHVEDDSFQSAAHTRCYICYTLRQACPREVRQYIRFFRTFFAIERNEQDHYLMQMTIELPQCDQLAGIPAQVIEPYGNFKILPKTDVPNAGHSLGLTPSTFSKRCRSQVRDWLQGCSYSHESCIEDWRTTSSYKMRLLNVSINPARPEEIRLEDFENGAYNTRYVTMSHCWSRGRQIELVKLTTENSQTLHLGFPIASLPKKFRDAVEIARWMQIGYLWIDALCIVQDNAEDWQQQSNVMGNIYAGSYCNIAATNGDEDAGCFVDRPLEVVEPLPIENPESDSLERTHFLGYDDVWCNTLLDTTLHTRAWVLQERLLSPRTIHFGQDQMFWECRKHKACEAYPDGVPREFSNRRTDTWRQGEDMFKPDLRAIVSERHTLRSMLEKSLKALWPGQASSYNRNSHQAYHFWRTTVERYMECKLSVASDKLVAISGIADKLRQITSERYLAGLWDNEYLPQSLLWYVPVREQADGLQAVRVSPATGTSYRAPSWSWASLEARIKYNWPTKCDTTLIRVIETQVETIGCDVGAVASAKMLVEGRLQAVCLTIAHRRADGTLKEDGTYSLRSLESRPTSGIASATSIEPTVYLDIPLAPMSTVNAYILPICTNWRNHNGLVTAAVAGLILKQSVLDGSLVYERIGVFGLNAAHAQELGVATPGSKVRFAQHMRSSEQITLI